MLPEVDRGRYLSSYHTVTDTRPTSRKYVVNIFPKDITPWSGQDSNPGPSAPDPDALTTRPQRPQLYTTSELNVTLK